MEKIVIQVNGEMMVNVEMSVKKMSVCDHVCKKDHLLNPAICNCENRKYLASIMDDSVIMWDEVIESYENTTRKQILMKDSL